MLFSNEFDNDLGDERFGRPCYDDICESHETDIEYKFKFLNEEDLINSKFFQNALLKTIALKDAEINSLRNELMKYY